MHVRNLGDHELVVEKYKELQHSGLVLQQVGLRAVIGAMEHLLSVGTTLEAAQIMLDDSKQLLFSLHEVANERGLPLMSYT